MVHLPCGNGRALGTGVTGSSGSTPTRGQPSASGDESRQMLLMEAALFIYPRGQVYGGGGPERNVPLAALQWHNAHIAVHVSTLRTLRVSQVRGFLIFVASVFLAYHL